MAYSLLAFLGKQRNDMRQNLVSFNYLRYTSLQRGKAIFQAPELTNMARIVYATRVLVSRKTPWSDIERQVLEHYALPGGRAYTCDETTGLANQMLKTIPLANIVGISQRERRSSFMPHHPKFRLWNKKIYTRNNSIFRVRYRAFFVTGTEKGRTI